jgi:membrane-associated protease RseP (regulator of RpoE activity)
MQSGILDAVREAGFQVLSMEETLYSTNFYVAPVDTKQKFLSLFDKMKDVGFLPVLRRRGDDVVLSVVRSGTHGQSKENLFWVFGSLLVTAVTIGLDFVLRFPLIREIESAAGVETSFFASLATYVIGFLLVLGVHELGHKLTSMDSGVQTSGPYFIPGIPGVYPTFGAVILQKDIPKNRDELINIGISGPLLGFVAAVALGAVAIATGVQVPIDKALQISEQTGVPLAEMQPALQLLAMVLRKGDGALFMGALATPVWLGFAMTFLNLFPAGQLDGGHAARGALGQQGHKLLTIASIIGLLLAGFWFMALFAALTWGFRDHPGPLDDVSGLSLSTKVKLGVTLLVFLLCFSVF